MSPETQQNSVPKDSGQEPNGNGNATGLVKGSGSQTPSGQSVESTLSSGGPTKKSVQWKPELVTESTFVASRLEAILLYLCPRPPSRSRVNTVDAVRNVLGRWERKVGEATKKAESLAENTRQHLRTNPRLTEAAVGRIARGTKILAEGGYENIFYQTFETVPGEQVLKAYARYVSTSVGPVMGILYISTEKIAYCSDNPLSFKDDEQTEWSYYKVIIPLHELKAVNPSEKYIQLISVDNQDFWFMGFFNYDGTVYCRREVFQANKPHPER